MHTHTRTNTYYFFLQQNAYFLFDPTQRLQTEIAIDIERRETKGKNIIMIMRVHLHIHMT